MNDELTKQLLTLLVGGTLGVAFKGWFDYRTKLRAQLCHDLLSKGMIQLLVGEKGESLY
jgi:hypothetical protein